MYVKRNGSDIDSKLLLFYNHEMGNIIMDSIIVFITLIHTTLGGGRGKEGHNGRK